MRKPSEGGGWITLARYQGGRQVTCENGWSPWAHEQGYCNCGYFDGPGFVAPKTEGEEGK